MPPFVVDASLTLAWCFADEANPYSRKVLAVLQTTHALVPALWPFEVANVLTMAERRGRITSEGTADFLERLRLLPIQVERREALWVCQQVLTLTRQHRVNAYDAAYLELATRERLALATLDGDLAKAARATGVPLVEVR